MDTLKQQKLDNIMDIFDFGKVHTCMVALDWKWASWGEDDGVPEEFHLRREARKHLIEVMDSSSGYLSTGGFAYKYEGTTLSLTFKVEEWNSIDAKH